MKACKTITETYQGLKSLLVGLGVTGQNYVKPQITTFYPFDTVDNLSTFKGHIQLVGKPKQPEVPKCICCMLCVTSCPSSCIKVVKTKPPKVEEPEGGWPEGEEPPKPKAPKTPSKWSVDFSLCSLCGTCAEVCPVNSIKFSNDSYVAKFDKSEFTYDLMADLKERAKNAPTPKPKKKAEPAAEEAAE